MKVALIGRSSMNAVIGGDSIQLMRTAMELRKAGHIADTYLAFEKIPYQQYDLLHFFNVIRPADHLRHIRRSQKPYVISTIYLDYSLFDKHRNSQAYRYIFKLLGRSWSEYIKNLYRYFTRQDRLVSPEYLLGHRKSMRKVLQGASMLLPNSTSEYLRLSKEFGSKYPHFIIPNGIDKGIFEHIPSGIKREKKVICVAQIYGMKNQHRLIMACNELDYPLDIIGRPPPNHLPYYNYCRNIAGPNVRFIDFIPQKELVNHYAAAEVHALPSWFETTGLSSLEAAAMGCKIVAGQIGDAREYLQEDAWYCDPADINSLKSALKKAMESEYNDGLRQRTLERYTWENAARETIRAYKKCLEDE